MALALGGRFSYISNCKARSISGGIVLVQDGPIIALRRIAMISILFYCLVCTILELPSAPSFSKARTSAMAKGKSNYMYKIQAKGDLIGKARGRAKRPRRA